MIELQNLTKMRNAKFHGKFFSMLDLAWEYWEPVGGLVHPDQTRCAVNARPAPGISLR